MAANHASENIASSPIVDDDPTAIRLDKTFLELFLFMGINRKWFLGNVAIVGLFAGFMHTWYYLLAYPPIHLALWLATKKDPDNFNAYLKYRKQYDYYEPRQTTYVNRGARPIGFGRGTPC